MGQFHLHFLVDGWGVIGGWWVSEFFFLFLVFSAAEGRALSFLQKHGLPPLLTPRHQPLVFNCNIIPRIVFFSLFCVLQGPCLLHHLSSFVSHLSTTLHPPASLTFSWFLKCARVFSLRALPTAVPCKCSASPSPLPQGSSCFSRSARHVEQAFLASRCDS